MYHKKTIFLFVFSTYLPVFLLKLQSRELVGCRIKFCIQRVPTLHTFDGPCYHHHHFFSGISCFWGSSVYQKYAEWVLIGCGIIQQALPIKI